MPKVNKNRLRVAGRKDIHPKSRRAQQLQREVHRLDKLDKNKGNRDSLIAAQASKLEWFTSEIEEDKELFNEEETAELIARYLNRFEEELQEIEGLNKLPGRHGNAKASRVDVINMVKDRETHLYEVGKFEGPDISSVIALNKLRAWDKSWKTLSSIKMKNYKKPTPLPVSAMETT